MRGGGEHACWEVRSMHAGWWGAGMRGGSACGEVGSMHAGGGTHALAREACMRGGGGSMHAVVRGACMQGGGGACMRDVKDTLAHSKRE